MALERSVDRSHWKLHLEGSSTVATQAAVDFVCDEGSVAILLNQLYVTNAGGPRPFEGLLRVKVPNDVPVETKLLELRETEK